MGKQKSKKVGRRDKDNLSKQSSYEEFLENTWKSKLESKEYTFRNSKSRPASTRETTENDEEKTTNQQATGSTVLLHRCKICRKAYVKKNALEKHEKTHEGKELKIPNKVAPETSAKTKDKSKRKKRSQNLTEDMGSLNTDFVNESNPVTNFPDTLASSVNASTIQPSTTINFHDIQDLISKPPNQHHSLGEYQNAPGQQKEDMNSVDSSPGDGLVDFTGFQDKQTLVYPLHYQIDSFASSSSSSIRKNLTSKPVKKPAIFFQPEEDEEPVCKSSISSRSEDVLLATMSTDEEVHTQVTKILDFLQTEENDDADTNGEDPAMNMVPVTLQPMDDQVEDKVDDEHQNSAKNSLNVRDLDMKSILVSSEKEKENADIPEEAKQREDLRESNDVEDDGPYDEDNGEDDDHFSDMDDDDEESSGKPVVYGDDEKPQIKKEEINKADVSEENEIDSKSEMYSKDNKKDDSEEDIHVDDVKNLEDMEDKDVKSTSLFSCSVCHEEFEDDDALQTHRRKHVTICLQGKIKSEEFPCDICGKKFKSKIGLNVHKKIHSRTGQVQDKIKTGDPDLCCDKCGENFKNKTGLNLHKKIHSKILQCRECDRVFERSVLLRQHMISHSKIQHICETCGKTYTTASHLRTHIASSHDDSTYECEVCGKVFRHTTNLKKHMQTHFGAKSFVCEVCGMAFLFSSCLGRHMRIHRDEKDFVCKTCGKAFRRSYALKTHMLTHTKEKPYKCVKCGEGFNHNVSLKTHMEKVHYIERF